MIPKQSYLRSSMRKNLLSKSESGKVSFFEMLIVITIAVVLCLLAITYFSTGVSITAGKGGIRTPIVGVNDNIVGLGGATQIPTLPAPQPGEPRYWEGSIDAGTYSSTNLYNGNLFSHIALENLEGQGPNLSIEVFHNSANVNASLPLTRGMGFNLGPGYSITGSAQLILEPNISPTKITAIYDDGSREIYNLISGVWKRPAGTYSTLSSSGLGWRLKFKDQSYYQFDSTGLLQQIGDSLGNTADVIRNPQGRLDKIVKNSTNLFIQFLYEDNGKLREVYYPRPSNEFGNSPFQDRHHVFDYVADRLDSITDTMGHAIRFQYDAAGRIRRLEDKDNNAYEYSYHPNGKTWVITDPQGSGNPLPPRLTQTLSYAINNSQVTTTYQNRRPGASWVYRYNNGNLTSLTDPLNHSLNYVYDTDRNLTSYKDAFNYTWIYTFDGQGNRLSARDPLGNLERWSYGSLNNVTSYIDQAGNETVIAYGDTHFPTLPTEVYYPATATDPIATTQLGYYPPEEGNHKKGQLALLINPNGVWTGWDYDAWGHAKALGEGNTSVTSSTDWISQGTWYASKNNTSAGQPFSGLGGGSAGGGWSLDPKGRITGSYCILVASEMPPQNPPIPPGFPVLCSGPSFGNPDLHLTAASYSNMDEMLSVRVNGTFGILEQSFQMDELGNTTQQRMQQGSINRTFNYSSNFATGEFTRTGPDNVESYYRLDIAGRLEFFRRGAGVEGPFIMSASFSYYENDLLKSIQYQNGTSVLFSYDQAGRLTRLTHRGSTGSLIQMYQYTYDARGLPISIEESNSATQVVANLQFDYDSRKRLFAEQRTGTNPYSFVYSYDQGGNRKSKHNLITGLKTIYHYDVDVPNPNQYGSFNDRLEYVEVLNDTVVPPTLISKTWYYYNFAGNIRAIVTRQENQPNHYSAIRFGFGVDGVLANYVWGEEWNGNSCSSAGPDYQITFAKQFQYDAFGQRVLEKSLDPAAIRSNLNNPPLIALGHQWSDFEEDRIYGDFFKPSGAPISNLRSFEPGVAYVNPWVFDGSENTNYFHGDHIGSVRAASDSLGNSSSQSVYSAFGEIIQNQNQTRFGYAGAWGYQSQQEFPFLWVGARYYDPGRGAFLGRDPIGVLGGENVYTYVENNPLMAVDPSGLRVLAQPIPNPPTVPNVPGVGGLDPYNPKHRGRIYLGCGVWADKVPPRPTGWICPNCPPGNYQPAGSPPHLHRGKPPKPKPQPAPPKPAPPPTQKPKTVPPPGVVW